MLIALTGDKDTSTLDMRQLAEYKLRTRLLAIPGVGQVTVLGGRLPEYQVVYDPNKLKLAGVDLSSLKTAIEESQSSVPAGYLEDVAGQELPIQQDTRTANIEQLNRALVPDHASGILRLQDVAEVKIDGAPRRATPGSWGRCRGAFRAEGAGSQYAGPDAGCGRSRQGVQPEPASQGHETAYDRLPPGGFH